MYDNRTRMKTHNHLTKYKYLIARYINVPRAHAPTRRSYKTKSKYIWKKYIRPDQNRCNWNY